MAENGTVKALTLAAAGAAVEEIENHCGRLVGMRASIAGKLEALEQSAGDRYLAGDRSAIKEIDEFNSELNLIERALNTLGRRRHAAGVDLRRAEAADVRRQAGVKRSDLGALEKETGKHLAALSGLEGIQYRPGILSLEPRGHWYADGVQSPQPWQGAFVDLYPDPTNNDKFAIPRSRQLRREIAELDAKAAAIEQALQPQATEPEGELVSTETPNFADRSFANKPDRGEWGQ